ncbi:hypothetical protein GCM10011338_13120 [Alteromonas lipolytica]|uniref:Uncharacterized protein n=2 Tax=Alteromonas lipolytica TaxID=1856405 RepID=A0A1E8FB41_9ALTE|nr:hypothetical protein BFC17_02470 [Alteromonas lipolytica]GGF62099.1 hypothetical protein GCM10011338_13120 [Alteromonas lipolytica]
MNHQSTSLSRWLIGAPTLEISALQSNQAMGTDEIEVRLGVQLQRPDNVDLFDQMADMSDAILSAQQQQQSLLVSGLVRQRSWDALLAHQRVISLRDKRVWLQRLGSQLTQRFNAGELSRLAYLQWQQQQLDVEQALLSAEGELTASMQAYSELTGAQSLPATINEQPVANLDMALNGHPEFKLLSLQQKYTAAAYEYSRQSQNNWDVALVARRLQSVLGNENLLGVAVGIPLSVEAPANPQDLQAWQQTDQALSQSLMNLRLSLQQQLRLLTARLASLSAQIAIAEQQVALGEQIVEQLEQLKQNSELEQSNWLQSLLEQRDRTYALDLQKLSQQQLVAQINQLAGQVL